MRDYKKVASRYGTNDDLIALFDAAHRRDMHVILDMKNRLGISVSKKVGNSVVRHRITRLVRESYRLNESLFKKNLDIVVIARNSANGTNYHEIEKSFMDLARKHGIAGDNVNEETSY